MVAEINKTLKSCYQILNHVKILNKFPFPGLSALLASDWYTKIKETIDKISLKINLITRQDKCNQISLPIIKQTKRSNKDK